MIYSKEIIVLGRPDGEAGWALPYKEANGDVPLDGVVFHDWIDYNGVAFSKELLG